MEQPTSATITFSSSSWSLSAHVMRHFCLDTRSHTHTHIHAYSDVRDATTDRWGGGGGLIVVHFNCCCCLPFCRLYRFYSLCCLFCCRHVKREGTQNVGKFHISSSFARMIYFGFFSFVFTFISRRPLFAVFLIADAARSSLLLVAHSTVAN